MSDHDIQDEADRFMINSYPNTSVQVVNTVVTYLVVLIQFYGSNSG